MYLTRKCSAKAETGTVAAPTSNQPSSGSEVATGKDLERGMGHMT